MNNNNIIKKPVVLIFIVLYIFSVILVLLKDSPNAFAFIGMSIGILFLIWLTTVITQKIRPPDFKVRKPGIELVFGSLIFLTILNFTPLRHLFVTIFNRLINIISIVWNSVSLPELKFISNWDLKPIFRKNLLFVIIPFTFLKIRKNSFSSMGLTIRDWKKNLKIGLIIFLAMAIPGTFYSNTASLIINGKLSINQILIGFLSSFTYYFFMAGFPEEFFYRAFLQTRFSLILKSKISGVVLVSLLFGLPHITDIIQWYPDITIYSAFCRAFFVQTFFGLITGVLWARTGNLIPCILLHTGVNGLNNLWYIVSKFGI